MSCSQDPTAGFLTARTRMRPIAQARPLPPGIGLAVGGAASLGLWAGLAHLVMRLVG